MAEDRTALCALLAETTLFYCFSLSFSGDRYHFCEQPPKPLDREPVLNPVYTRKSRVIEKIFTDENVDTTGKFAP